MLNEVTNFISSCWLERNHTDKYHQWWHRCKYLPLGLGQSYIKIKERFKVNLNL